jgi:hypothetical protein
METTIPLDTIPIAAVPYPKEFWSRAKYIFWRTITPSFLKFRNLLLKFRIIHHEGRQNFLIGKLKSQKSVKPFLAYLQGQGFGNHFIAWLDEGQVISLRRLEGFEHQYHLRIFHDGEIRAHYEYTPEAHPWWHFKEKDIQERRAEFIAYMGDWITPTRLVVTPGTQDPKRRLPHSSVRRAVEKGASR